MSRVHVLGVVGEEPNGDLKVLISCSETPETWKFVLRNNLVILVSGRTGAECGSLFSEARTLAEGELHKAARISREIATTDPETVVRISRKQKTWHDTYGIAGTD